MWLYWRERYFIEFPRIIAYTSHYTVGIVMRTSNAKFSYIWFTQNAILSRKLLIILIGLTWKEVRTSMILLTYLFKSNIKIP